MRLREGYKKTEVGMIPKDWNVIPLHQVISSLDTGVSVNSMDESLTVFGHAESILKTSCVANGYFYPDECKKILPKDICRARLNPKKDSIIISRMNTPALVGESGYINGDYPNLFLPDRLWQTSFKHDASISVKWLAYILSFDPFSKVIKKTSTGTSDSMKNIAKDSLLNIRIPYPTKTEQTAIANALSDADAWIQSLTRLIAKKRQIKQGAMQELLRPKDDWVKKKLGDTAILKARIGWQGLTTAEYLESGNFFLVTGTEFQDGYIDWSNCHYVEEWRYKQDKNIQLKINDILVTKDGTIGKVALIFQMDKPATLNSGVFVIRPIKDAFDPVFFYYILCSKWFSEFLNQLSAGSTINHLYQKDFVNFSYKTPYEIEEQTQIAAILSDMDKEIAILEIKLIKAQQIKQGMMQNLLTGRIRLI